MNNLSLTIKKNKYPIKIFAIIGLCLLGDAMFYSVLPTRLDIFSFSGAQLGILLAVNRIIRLGSNFWAAKLYEKWNRSIPFKIAVILSVFITFSYGYVVLFWHFFILRLLWGISFSLLRLKALLIIFDSNLPENLQGKLSGLFRSISRSGYMAGMILGGYFADLFNFSISAYLLSAITGIALFFIFSEDKEYNKKVNKKSFSPTPKMDFFHLITSKSMYGLMFMGFALNFTGLGLINSSYGLYLKNVFGETAFIFGTIIGIATLNGFILSTQSLFELILSPLFGNIVDKYKINKFITHTFILQAVLMSILAFFQNSIVALLVPLFIFINTAFLILLLFIEVSNLKINTVSKRMAGFTTAVDLGAASGPLILIFLDFGFSLSSLYFLSAILLFIAGLQHYLFNK